MKKLNLTNRQARRFLLAHQSLWPPRQLRGKEDLLDYINRVGCIQFDPLNIAGNNPELVLQSRISKFNPGMLKELLYVDRALVDGWDKNMSIYPVEDWPYFHRRREAIRGNSDQSYQAVHSILPQVRQALQERGPLSSIDLDFDQNVEWSWAPTRLARAALESMYDWGELVIHHKVHTRRVYDFASHHISPALLTSPDPNESEAQYHDWYLHRRIGSIGLAWNRAGDAWLGMYGMKSPERKSAFERLIERELLMEVAVEGIEASFYMRSEDKETLDRMLSIAAPAPRATVLAPLDNLLWDRRLVRALFDFYYIWEVYKPAVERQFGYYVLPILYGDRFVARFEPGRDKESGGLIIKNWWWEEGIRPSKTMQTALMRCFKRFLHFLEADRLIIERKTINAAGLEWLADLT
jgi:uncharacterized protein YcaQ